MDPATLDTFHVQLSYSRGRGRSSMLSISTGINMDREGAQWKACSLLRNVALPDVAYLGFTAVTGHLHDRHEVVSLSLRPFVSADDAGSVAKKKQEQLQVQEVQQEENGDEPDDDDDSETDGDELPPTKQKESGPDRPGQGLQDTPTHPEPHRAEHHDAPGLGMGEEEAAPPSPHLGDVHGHRTPTTTHHPHRGVHYEDGFNANTFMYVVGLAALGGLCLVARTFLCPMMEAPSRRNRTVLPLFSNVRTRYGLSRKLRRS